ncbi:acyltransferase [Nocardioides solisilvae]|uniref:acyltransferase n=1 Tax=Nocardioides solisilvae TaxID=1542435 RepID=UPI0023B82815|nr:acyltransferase [Nocardioides solisilvae]
MSLGNLYWKAMSVLWYTRRFGSMGRRSWIRKPLLLRYPKQIHIGRHCMIRDGARLEVVNRPNEKPGHLWIGDNVTIEQGAHIVASCEVHLDDEVAIAPRVTIVDATHPVGTAADGNRARQLAPGTSYVRLEKRVFIGANVVILPNVTIGRNSIVGANSVVARDIPPNSIAVGAPARVIKSFDS